MESSNDTLKRYYNKKKKRKQKRKFVFYSMLVVFFVLLITTLSLTVFFNINDIAVTGNNYYSAQTLIEASGLKHGQNLFRLNKFKIIDSMYEKLPYISELKIDRHLPVGIEIIVTECKPFVRLEQGSDFYILDRNLKVLEKTDTCPETLPPVTGIIPTSITVGKTLTDENGAANRLSALCASLDTHFHGVGVSAIDVSVSYDITFLYMDRIKVKVGTAENIPTKLQLAKYIVNENRSNEYAVLDVSGEKAYYRPVDKTDVLGDIENDEKTLQEN